MARRKMPLRTRAFLIATIAGMVGLAYVLQPWADTAAVIAVVAVAPAATTFAVLYGLTAPWWETLIGRAMLISSAGLALLVDISLLYMWLGDEYQLRDMVRLTVYFTIALGAWYKAIALVHAKIQGRRNS